MITIWLFNITMENGTFTDGLPNLKMGGIFHGYVKEPDGNHKVIHFLKCFIIIIF